MHDLERHIILYCKGHYKKTELMTDLKVIVGKFCDISIEHIENKDVYYWVTKIYFEFYNKYQIVSNFLDLFKWENQHDYKSIIKFMCSYIAILPIKNKNEIIIDLGEPDYTLLPKKEA